MLNAQMQIDTTICVAEIYSSKAMSINCFSWILFHFSVIAGLEVEMEHCTIENTNNSVNLTPVGESLCSVNGNLVEETTKLTQGKSHENCNSSKYLDRTALERKQCRCRSDFSFRCMDTPLCFSAIFTKGNNFCHFLFAFLDNAALSK